MRYPTAPVSIGVSVGLAISLFLASVIAVPGGFAQSREPDKTLKLFFGHTGERGEFTFKRNGHYDRAELNRINHFLRDWRRNEETHMDPQLLDLVWAIYQESGSHDYIHVVSAYRSPATNEMLRSRSRGVAKNSQHRLGRAMDWFLTDVPLAKLRAIAMKMQGGGVGYYPRSGSPFVHTDTGSVRAWPRMSRQQLLALFPNGNTLHLPADGKPLPGYEQAVARRQSGNMQLAYLDSGEERDTTKQAAGPGIPTNWLTRVFASNDQNGASDQTGTGDQADEDVADASSALDQTQGSTAGDQPQVDLASAEVTDSRIPRPRPASQMEVALAALHPADQETGVTLETPALPHARPTLFPNGLGNQPATAEDAIAALTARMDTFGPLSGGTASTPSTELAYASLQPTFPSEADRAILTAFAAADDGSVGKADPALVAAIRARAGVAPTREEAAPIVIAANDTGTGANQGAVLLPAGISPQDEDSLADLIHTPAATNSDEAQLAMPSPQSTLYDVPEGAAQVADLRGDSGPPVDRFSRTPAHGDANQGFFSRLIATLIE